MFTIPQFQYFKWNTVTAVTPIAALTEFYDTFYNYVSLIINAESTLAVYNNSTFIDSSTNNFSVSTVGTPSQGSFSPYSPAGWSVLCQSGYIQFPDNPVFKLSTSDFTIEFWGYNTATRPAGAEPWKFGVAGVDVYANGIIYYYSNNTSSQLLLGVPNVGWATPELGSFSHSVPPTLYEWHHYATVRKGKYITTYIDGIAVQRAVYSAAIGSGEAGFSFGGYIGLNFNGYISDFRVIKGEAIYSGDTFNPPTTPLQSTPNTILLTCNSNKIEDKSSYGWALTAVNAPPVIPTSPYTDFNSSNYSGYFRGSTSYITYTTNTNYALSGSSFTVECWAYPTSLAGGNGYYTLVDAGLSAGWDLSLKNDGSVSWQANSLRTDLSAGVITRAKWYHIAASYSTQTSLVSVFVDGNLIGTSTALPASSATVALQIGRASNNTQLFTGYISNVRLTKGASRYTSNFTPATSALTSDSNTMLLTLNSPIVFDNSSKVNSFANSNIAMTRISPFKTRDRYSYDNYSLYFDGGTMLGLPDLSAIELSGIDFTLEYWSKSLITTTNTAPTFVLGDNLDKGWGGWPTLLYLTNSSGPLSAGILMGNGAGSTQVNRTFVAATNTSGQWRHVAVTKRGNTISTFVNGLSVFGATVAPAVASYGRPWAIGNYITSTSTSYRGYLSNVRVVSGQAIYTGNFAPPTSPLLSSTIGTTGAGVANSLSGRVVLLTLNGDTIEDKSTNQTRIVLNGAMPLISRDNPFSPSVSTTPFEYTVTYAQSAHGGSAYFNGSSYITSTAPPLTGNYTLECWFYKTGTGSSGSSIFHAHAGAATGTHVWINASNQLVIDNGGVGETAFTTFTIANNVWYHLAIVRSGSTTTAYLNGAVAGSNSYTPATNDKLTVGRYITDSRWVFVGYISDIRLVNGSTVYTTTFTPPTATLSLISNTSILLKMNNGAILDTNTEANIVLSGGASSTDSMAKYGGRSIQLNGTSQFFFRPETESVIITTGIPYTFEGWFYPTTTSYLSARVLFSKRTATANQINYAVYADATTGNLCFQTGSSIFKSTSALTLSAWNHVAMVYDGGRVYLYKDGTRVISTSALAAVTNNAGSSLYFGYDFNTKGNFFEGYIDEIRATKGLIRYGGETFTVPSSSFLTT